MESLFRRTPVDIFNQSGKIAVVVEDGRELTRAAVIQFYSQCEEDVISTAFLRDNFGVIFDDSKSERLANSITGREEYRSLGKCDIRWWTSRSNLLRYERSTCHVIDSDLFDIFIGAKTIRGLGIYKARCGIIAAFISQQPSVNGQSQLPPPHPDTNVPFQPKNPPKTRGRPTYDAMRRKRIKKDAKERRKRSGGATNKTWVARSYILAK
jgi:hypothetical protein